MIRRDRDPFLAAFRSRYTLDSGIGQKFNEPGGGGGGYARLESAFRSLKRVAFISSDMTFVSASTGRKLVSPFQRGTMGKWTCRAIPAPAVLPILHPTLNPSGREADRRTAVIFFKWTITSSDSASVRSEREGVCRYGTTRRCPLLYGNLFMITKHRSPLATICSSSSLCDAAAAHRTHSSPLFSGEAHVSMYLECPG